MRELRCAVAERLGGLSALLAAGRRGRRRARAGLPWREIGLAGRLRRRRLHPSRHLVGAIDRPAECPRRSPAHPGALPGRPLPRLGRRDRPAMDYRAGGLPPGLAGAGDRAQLRRRRAPPRATPRAAALVRPRLRRRRMAGARGLAGRAPPVLSAEGAHRARQASLGCGLRTPGFGPAVSDPRPSDLIEELLALGFELGRRDQAVVEEALELADPLRGRGGGGGGRGGGGWARRASAIGEDGAVPGALEGGRRAVAGGGPR